jgi:hypothetical protein
MSAALSYRRALPSFEQLALDPVYCRRYRQRVYPAMDLPLLGMPSPAMPPSPMRGAELDFRPREDKPRGLAVPSHSRRHASTSAIPVPEPGRTRQSKLAVLFPGAGSQYVGMGAFLLKHYKAAREVWEEAEEVRLDPFLVLWLKVGTRSLAASSPGASPSTSPPHQSSPSSTWPTGKPGTRSAPRPSCARSSSAARPRPSSPAPPTPSPPSSSPPSPSSASSRRSSASPSRASTPASSWATRPASLPRARRRALCRLRMRSGCRCARSLVL